MAMAAQRRQWRRSDGLGSAATAMAMAAQRWGWQWWWRRSNGGAAMVEAAQRWWWTEAIVEYGNLIGVLGTQYQFLPWLGFIFCPQNFDKILPTSFAMLFC
jgi:hypothetical protein